ncbi:MAG TPA: FAD-dependent oxidoreductase, partial [Polyangiaceae bacterium]
MEWFKKKRRWDLEVDVVVLGTGAAGMTAALAAHEGGAKVALLEKAALVGGTTAVSGGVVWVPNNRHLAEVGIRDSRDEALKYITRLTDGRSRDDLVERFVDAAPEMLDWVEAQTTLRFAALAKYPDYHPEFEG